MSTYPVLNDRPIDQWKVTELKDELRRRELPIKGLKDDLVKRLAEALQGQVIDGGEETVSGIPPAEDQKEDETVISADASGCEASMEQSVDEGPSDVAAQNESLVSVTEASKDNVIASQEAVVDTAEVSLKTLVAVTEVSEAPLVDVAATDEISLGAAEATKGDDLESVPSDSNVVEEVYSHAEVHSEVIAEKAPDNGNSKKITVDDISSDDTITVTKLDESSAKGEPCLDIGCEILEQEAKPSPPDVISSHADAVASAQEQNADSLILKKNFSDNDLMYEKDQKDSKHINGDCKPIQSGPKDQVSEVNPDLESQIKCVSISNDNISVNANNSVEGSLNADSSDLELESKQDMVKSSSSNPPVGDGLQMLGDGKDLIDMSLQDTDMNLDKKEGSPDSVYPEKLNLDRSSGDESMEEDVMETKHGSSNEKSDYLEDKTEVTGEHVVKEVILPDSVTVGSSVHEKEDISKEKTVVPTEKRKAEGQEVVANNEPIKRLRLLNVDTFKPKQPTSKLSGSDSSKDVHQPARRRSFGRSDSTAREDSPKERIVPPPQKPATTSLRIDRFVRPFTLKAVQELLGKTGSVCSFWMDHIKTHCYVTYFSVEEALATRNAVYNLQWPPNNGSYLVAEFVDPHEVKGKLEPPPAAPISPSAATTPKEASSQQSNANQTMPPHAAGTSRGLLPTPQGVYYNTKGSTFPILAKLPSTSDNGPAAKKLPPPPKNPEPPVVTLDDLFRKTEASPRIYYMPLSEEVVSAKLAARGKGKRGALAEYHAKLRMMKNLRDSLNSRIAARLEAKRKGDEQRNWRVSKAQDIKELRDHLTELKRRNATEKKKAEQASRDLKERTASLNLAFVTLKKKRGDSSVMHTNAMKAAQMGLMATASERLKMQSKAIKQLCRLFPLRRVIIDGDQKDGYSGPYDVICNACLPHGLDPHSVPSEELSASLGYMLQLLNIAVLILSAPALHVSGFGRSSYWSTRQSQR
ncbi:hypothetical protein E2562_013233 [Oryza meyeriana var. granulata]|uniref:SAP domain-containing protein n=1 Tax=Oryza meyeriana var. granulata TaxID=110450 RepID=A0A6G1D3A0_9ORYZ|nr:hypothetical protein E2562_013233 [Oryza meyeriana var. granulata]